MLIYPRVWFLLALSYPYIQTLHDLIHSHGFNHHLPEFWCLCFQSLPPPPPHATSNWVIGTQWIFTEKNKGVWLGKHIFHNVSRVLFLKYKQEFRIVVTLESKNSSQLIKKALSMDEFTQGEYVTREEKTTESRNLGVNNVSKLSWRKSIRKNYWEGVDRELGEKSGNPYILEIKQKYGLNRKAHR